MKKTKKATKDKEILAARKAFLRSVWLNIEYWRKIKHPGPDTPAEEGKPWDDVQARLEGLAFSILVSLDSGMGRVGPFRVVQVGDKKERDIAGKLHDNFHDAGRIFYGIHKKKERGDGVTAPG